MQVQIQNLSQLKKALTKGQRYRIIQHYYCPELVGQVREVVKVQTNGVWLKDPKNKDNKINKGRGSWLGFGKATNWSFGNSLCTVYSEAAIILGEKEKIFYFQLEDSY